MKKNIYKKLLGLMRPSAFVSAISGSLLLMSCMTQTGGYSETDGVYYNPNTDTLPTGYYSNNMDNNSVGNYYDYSTTPDLYSQSPTDPTYNGWQRTGITSDWGTYNGSETNYYNWNSPWYGYGYYPGFSIGWGWGSPWGWNSGFNWGWNSPWYGGGYYDPFWGGWYSPWYSGMYNPYYYGGYYGGRWGNSYPRRASGADRVPASGNRMGIYNRGANSMTSPGVNRGNSRIPAVQNNRSNQNFPNMNNGRIQGGQMRNSSPQYTPNQEAPRNNGFRDGGGFRNDSGAGFRSGGFGGGSSTSGGGMRSSGGFRTGGGR